VTRKARWFGCVCAVLGSAGSALATPDGAALPGWSGRAPPPPPLEVEPAALPRSAEFARRPVELVPELGVLLSTCEEGANRARCQALGPGFGFGLSALHRPNPYFAFGGAATYTRSGGGLPGAGSVSAHAVGFGLVGRVYLLEKGALDPYLELSLGWSAHRTSLNSAGSPPSEEAAFGPAARAGGGVDYVAADALKIGVAAGLNTLVFATHERCEAGRCELGSATGAAVSGGLVAALRVTLALGDPL
jgi:hypothetical protein